MRPHILLASALSLACTPQVDDNAGRGTVEYTQTDVAAVVLGRLVRVTVDEGEYVAPGDTIAILSQSPIGAELETRRARIAAAQAELRDLRAGARPAELQRARAEVAAATADAERARRDANRFKALLADGGISAANAEATETAAVVAERRLETARETLALLEQGARPDRIRAAEGALRQAQSQLASLEASAGDLVVVAPQAGVVVGRHAEPGEVLGAGVPIVSLGDAKRLWARVFVSPGLLSTLRVGEVCRATVEGIGGRTFDARIVAIATTAEFTPRVALTETERADLLFGVKVALADTTGELKAGLPVAVRCGATPSASDS